MQLFAAGSAKAIVTGSVCQLAHAIVNADALSAESAGGVSWGASARAAATARSTHATAPRRILATFMVE